MKIKILDARLTKEMIKPHHPGDAGIDIYACNGEDIILHKGEKFLMPTGIRVAIPEGWVGLLLPRSSTGSKGLHLANTTGVIDSSYRGEIMMNIMCARSNRHEQLIINRMDKIAQLIIVPHFLNEKVQFVTDLDATSRGSGSFGSTGK